MSLIGAASDAAELTRMLERTGKGDRAAFEEVYRRTSVKLFRVCQRILPERQEAEEALQETYLVVWRRAEAFDVDRGSAMTWLITLARNSAVDRLRRDGKLTALRGDFAGEPADTAPSAVELITTSDDEHQLAWCLDTLDSGDCQLIRSAFYEGSTYSELADRAATPLGTIKSRIRRALIKLRECLE